MADLAVGSSLQELSQPPLYRGRAFSAGYSGRKVAESPEVQELRAKLEVKEEELQLAGKYGSILLNRNKGLDQSLASCKQEIEELRIQRENDRLDFERTIQTLQSRNESLIKTCDELSEQLEEKELQITELERQSNSSRSGRKLFDREASQRARALLVEEKEQKLQAAVQNYEQQISALKKMVSSLQEEKQRSDVLAAECGATLEQFQVSQKGLQERLDQAVQRHREEKEQLLEHCLAITAEMDEREQLDQEREAIMLSLKEENEQLLEELAILRGNGERGEPRAKGETTTPRLAGSSLLDEIIRLDSMKSLRSPRPSSPKSPSFSQLSPRETATEGEKEDVSRVLKEEYFYLTAMALKHRHPSLPSLSHSEIASLFQEARRQSVPFFQWESWLTERLTGDRRLPSSRSLSFSKPLPRSLSRTTSGRNGMLGLLTLSERFVTYVLTVEVEGPLGLEIGEEKHSGVILVSGFTPSGSASSAGSHSTPETSEKRKSSRRLSAMIQGFVWGQAPSLPPLSSLSPLCRSGIVRRGDRLIEINGKVVRGLPFQDVVSWLREAPRPVVLAFQRLIV